ncbi:hypothetical protein BGZ52_012712, partial [Haplosporangium bisporale]
IPHEQQQQQQHYPHQQPQHYPPQYQLHQQYQQYPPQAQQALPPQQQWQYSSQAAATAAGVPVTGISSGYPGGPSNGGGSSENLYDRSTEGIPKTALDQSAAAKYRLEHHYSLSLEQAIERSE